MKTWPTGRRPEPSASNDGNLSDSTDAYFGALGRRPVLTRAAERELAQRMEAAEELQLHNAFATEVGAVELRKLRDALERGEVEPAALVREADAADPSFDAARARERLIAAIEDVASGSPEV